MTGPDRRTSELEETGDAWLAISALSIVAGITLTAVLCQYFSFYAALAASVLPAIIIGWGLSLIRPVRRIVTAIVHLLFDAIAFFS